MSASPTTAPDAAAPRSVWHGHDFRLAWAGGLINDAGDWVLAVALPVYVYTETGSGTQTASLFVFQLLAAGILGPIGGSLVDRWNLRRCLIATNVAQALALLPLLGVTPDRIWPAYIAVVAQAALTTVNNPANVALLPRLVAPDQLTQANAALAAAQSIARLAGAPVGGAVVAFGGLGAVIVLDAVSFLLVAVAMLFLRSDTDPEPRTEGHHRRGLGIREGLRAMRAHPPLSALTAISGFAQLAQGSFVVLFVVFIVDAVGGDGTDVGLVRGTMAIGAVLGAVMIGRIASRVQPLRLWGLGFVGMGVVSLVFWNAPSVTTALWVYIVLFAASGIPGAALQVGLVTTVQTNAPRAVLGRVSGVLEAANSVGTALGSIATGLLVDVVPLRALLDGQASIYLISGALVLSLNRARGTTPGAAPRARRA